MGKTLYGKLATEKPNPASRGLDRWSSRRLAALMHREDRKAVHAVGRVGREIARSVELISARLAQGGRLFLAGAGTSGRLCVLEAAECPPTFNTPPTLIQAIMAGGRSSVFRSREGAEDRGQEARQVVRRLIRRGDVLVGVAASGVTNFALAALSEAKARGAGTILVTCNPPGRPIPADVVVAPATGPEVIAGSTRLKAGTATKLVLNALTTLSMVRLGKTYDHFMVDLQPRSQKLRARALRLVTGLADVSEKEAGRLLTAAGGRTKTAILMGRLGLGRREAERRLAGSGGFLRRALSL